MKCDIDTGTHHDIHLPFQYGWTALMKASWSGHIKCVKVLLDRGADVNMQKMVSAVWRLSVGDMFTFWCSEYLVCWTHFRLILPPLKCHVSILK